jgi:DNA-directed RNA polymerase subunit beta
MSQVKPGEVDYILPSHASAFSVTTNLIPFLQNNNGNRVGYSTQQQHQALSLRDREEPLVQSATTGGQDATTFEDVVGKVSGHNAKASGTVTKVTDRFVEVKDAKGKKIKHHLYKHFPLNNKKGYVSSYATVKPGDTVKKGQSVADNNFMKNGKLALGTNLEVGYVPADGYNFEDGIVISESAAQKLTSKHMYKKEFKNTQNSHIGARKFRSHYPTAFKKDQMENMEDDGVIKEGATVKPGDPLLLAVRKNEVTSEAEGLAKLSKGLVKDWKDASMAWEGDTEGKVVKVVKTGKKVKVHVRANEAMQVGDKLVGRHGNKGIVTKPGDGREKESTGHA